jgi:hypothetical protein
MAHLRRRHRDGIRPLMQVQLVAYGVCGLYEMALSALLRLTADNPRLRRRKPGTACYSPANRPLRFAHEIRQPPSGSCPTSSCSDLREQLHHMQAYAEVLARRIARQAGVDN